MTWRRRRGGDEVGRLAVVLALDLEALASRPLASLTLRRPVMSWLISRIARIGFSSVRSRITTPASIIRSTRSVAPTLSSVVHSFMLLSPTMTCSRPEALGVGVRLVAGVDDRAAARRRAGDALPDVLGPLADAVDGAARRLQHLAGADDDLPADQERDEDVGEPAELAVPARPGSSRGSRRSCRRCRCCS
jgi:hypothetical protein